MKIKVPRKPANTYQHGNLREALVQAGLKLLSEGGVEGLSLRAAAQLAGVSHAAPYRHFKDKDALVAAIAEQGFRLLTASMRAQLAVIDARHGADTHERRWRWARATWDSPGSTRVLPGDLRGRAGERPNHARVEAGGGGGVRAVAWQRGGRPGPRGYARWRRRYAVAGLLDVVHGLSHLLINEAVAVPSGPPTKR